MRLKWDIVLSELQALERQITCLRHAGISLESAYVLGDVPIAMRAIQDAQSALAAIAVTTTTIRRKVVPADGLGDTLGSLGELALRAMRMVVLATMGELRELLHGSEAFGRVARLLQDELDRIPGVWMPYRADAAAANRVLYRAAIRTAQQAVTRLRVDRDVARILRLMASQYDRPEVRLASMRIDAALSVNVDSEPNSPVIRSSMPLHAPSGSTPERAPARVLTLHAASKP